MILYQIYCDGYILDDVRTEDYIVSNPKLNFEKNKVSGLTFTILKTHPNYDKIKMKRSIIEVRKNGKAIFKGRCSEYTQEFDLSMNVDVEGVLSFFNDSVFDPFDFQGAPATLLTNVINNHNTQVQPWQRFKVGRIDQIDANDYVSRSSIDYLKSWEVIETRLLNIGGILRVRYEDDGNYIDWLNGTQSELNTSIQAIEYGENLIDLKKTNSAIETYTAVLPLGAKIENAEEETDTRLTIEALPDETSGDIVKAGKWIYSKSAVENHGWIAAPPNETTWDDVTIATNLFDKGKNFLQGDAIFITGTLEINAYDLGLTDDEVHSFNFLDYIPVNSSLHGVNEYYLLSKLELPYKQPQNTKITVGDAKKTLTDERLDSKYQIISLNEQVKEVRQDYTTNERLNEVISQEEINNTAVLQSAREIILAAKSDYVEKSTYEEYQKSVDTEFSVMAGKVAANFTTTTQHITDVDGDMQMKFNQFYKNIEFTENGIIIKSQGSDNALKMEIQVDSGIVSFKRNGVQFGWWDGVDFHTGNIVVDVTERAQFGNYAFVPRTDGSLMLLKVR